MFIDSSETVDLSIYYRKMGKHYVAYNTKDFEAMQFSPEEKDKHDCVNIKMKQLTWGLFNDLQEGAIVRGPNGERVWNYKLYKENRLKNLIISWDAKRKNAKGEVESVPATPENILSLSPDIAEAILTTYDSLTLLDEEEEKKSPGRCIATS